MPGFLHRRRVLTFTAIGVTAFIVLAWKVGGPLLHVRQIRRQGSTLRSILALGEALDSYASRHGAYPCVRAGASLPGIAVPTDAWGNKLIVVSSRRRYVILSYGSDGEKDASWAGESFESPAGDIIFSNGEWLHFPAAMSTAPRMPPKSEDALAETLHCDTAGLDPNVFLAGFYLYLPTRDAASCAAQELGAQGFSTRVRRSVTCGEWICIAERRLEGNQQFDLLPELLRVWEKNGGSA